MFVPHQEAWVVERMGKFHRILEPGLQILIPFLDRVKYVQSLKEIAIDGEHKNLLNFFRNTLTLTRLITPTVPKQSAITLDNVNLSIDGVLYLRIVNAYNSSYGVEDASWGISILIVS